AAAAAAAAADKDAAPGGDGCHGRDDDNEDDGDNDDNSDSDNDADDADADSNDSSPPMATTSTRPRAPRRKRCGRGNQETTLVAAAVARRLVLRFLVIALVAWPLEIRNANKSAGKNKGQRPLALLRVSARGRERKQEPAFKHEMGFDPRGTWPRSAPATATAISP
ncbi:hypothetical protein E4U42_007904, partial [Claviceps africana]